MGSLPLFKRKVLVSIRPEYASKIMDGEKTVELRRRFPEATAVGATILIYSSSPVQAIVGFATIKDVLRLPVKTIWRDHGAAACIGKADFDAYFSGLTEGYAIILKDVKSLSNQLKATDLQEEFGFVAPQSFRYVDSEYDALLKNERQETTRRHKRRHRA